MQSSPAAIPIPLEEQIEKRFVDLPDTAAYSAQDIRAFRARIRQERDEQTEACRAREKRWQAELNRLRKQLRDLNRVSSRDTPSASQRRREIHVDIAALEHAIRDKRREREQVIPVAFELKLAKLQLIEEWPARSREILRRIQLGHARERTHGDIEDIGYRRLAGNPSGDTALGEQAVRSMVSLGLMPPEIQDENLRRHVRAVAGKIAASSDFKAALRVTVLDSPEINAVGLPGGFLFVTSGLIAATQTEAELAGVLAREVARIAARQGFRESRRSIASKMVVPAVQVVSGLFTGGVANAGAYYGVSYGVQGLGMLMDRALAGSSDKYQKEADQLGMQYAWMAGYDPFGFIAFVDSIVHKKLSAQAAGFLKVNSTFGERMLEAFSEIRYLLSGNSALKD